MDAPTDAPQPAAQRWLNSKEPSPQRAELHSQRATIAREWLIPVLPTLMLLFWFKLILFRLWAVGVPGAVTVPGTAVAFAVAVATAVSTADAHADAVADAVRAVVERGANLKQKRRGRQLCGVSPLA